MKENKTLKLIIMITGVLTLLLGIYTLVRPLRTFLSIGWLFGILLLVNGIELVILSLSKEKKEIGACILGVLEGLAGIFLLSSGIQRFVTDVMAAEMVGGIQIIGGTKVYAESKGKGILTIVCGVLSVIVSLLAITHPILTMISAGYMIAFSVLMQGINMIVLGLNLGNAEK